MRDDSDGGKAIVGLDWIDLCQYDVYRPKEMRLCRSASAAQIRDPRNMDMVKCSSLNYNVSTVLRFSGV